MSEFKPKAWMRCPLCKEQSPMPDPDVRDWVGLTEEEVDQFHNWKDCTWSTNELVRHVEATLRIKNT